MGELTRPTIICVASFNNYKPTLVDVFLADRFLYLIFKIRDCPLVKDPTEWEKGGLTVSTLLDTGDPIKVLDGWSTFWDLIQRTYT